VAIKHLTFDDSATITFGALTNTYADLLALTDDIDMLFVFNTCNTAILLSVPSGITNLKPPTAVYKNIRMPASSSMAIDCRTNSKRIAKGTIQVKYDTAPASGEVTVTVCR
jgi:hypothetical protein